MQIGEMIRVLREARRMSQEELAGQLGLSQIAVSQHERGTREPTWTTVLGYADALGVDVSLFKDTDRWAAVAKEQARLAQVTEEVKAAVLREARAILKDARNTTPSGSRNKRSGAAEMGEFGPKESQSSLLRAGIPAPFVPELVGAGRRSSSL